jgi:hypothetical protein
MVEILKCVYLFYSPNTVTHYWFAAGTAIVNFHRLLPSVRRGLDVEIAKQYL